MTYAVGGLIQAADYNGFIASVNTAWNVGASSAGYGHPAFTNVAVGDIIRARPATVVASASPGTVLPTWSTTPEWKALVDTVNNMSLHQTGATLITAADFPASTTLPSASTSPPGYIAWASTLSSAITTVTGTQRLSATAQGSTTTNTATSAITWSSDLTATFTVAFANHDAARYFFNAGGQLGIQCSHPAGAVYDIDQLISDLCSDAGTIWISSTDGTPATISLAGTTYTGITKVGGSNPTGVITQLTNNGFYALNSTLTSVFRQTSDFGYHSYYVGTYLDISVSYNGSGTLTIQVKWDEVPNGYPGAVVSTGTQAVLTVRYPSTTVLTNTWGTPALSNVVAGT